MPPQPKTKDVVYSWIDESGQTHYSNYKVQADIPTAPATLRPTPANKPASENTTVRYQQDPPKPIKLTTANNGLNGIGTILFLLAIGFVFRLLIGRIGWKKKRNKNKSGRSSISSPKDENDKNGSFSLVKKVAPEVSTQTDHSRYLPMPQPIISDPEASSPKPSWNLDFIQRLDWREFEKLCARILQANGYRAQLGDIGPDGGVDLHIYRQDEPEQLIGIAQCKRQNQSIKIDTVRAFRWVMTSKQVDKGFFFTSGSFYKQARQFCEEQNIEVITGGELLIAIKKLSTGTQTEILDAILATDYMSHICVNCGIKMVKRTNKTTNNEFWGCVNYPGCNYKIGIRKRDQLEG
jgi:hypothetical protein